MSRKRRASARMGTLTLIGALLLGSAALRLATEAGQVIAKEIDGGHETEESLALPRAPDPDREHVAALLESLQERETRIAQREKDLQVRQRTLDVAEDEISRRLEQLTEAEARLRNTLSLATNAAEADLTRLTDVYANMKPKQASALFEQMDPSFAAGFLARMEPEVAARIMAGLSAERAYVVSIQLAGRNANAPKE